MYSIFQQAHIVSLLPVSLTLYSGQRIERKFYTFLYFATSTPLLVIGVVKIRPSGEVAGCQHGAVPSVSACRALLLQMRLYAHSRQDSFYDVALIFWGQCPWGCAPTEFCDSLPVISSCNVTSVCKTEVAGSWSSTTD